MLDEPVVYGDGDVRIVHPPNTMEVSSAPVAEDVALSRNQWLEWARTGQHDTLYFSVFRDNRLVGQIFLHDQNPQTGESLIGYHLFQPQDRGQGIGTQALKLLVAYVVERTNLNYLVIITDEDNWPSRRIAEKCGFTYAGPAREGPPLICFAWRRGD
jgi:RimJ/RimL family protein N-acetyltransferase